MTAGALASPSEGFGALAAKATGALAGAAVGDALGGAAEGNTPEAIQQRYGGFIEGIVPPFLADWRNARPIAPYHKGDGHITDDTLMTHVLVEVYDHVRDHLDAYAVAEHLVPLLLEERRWIPELEAEALLLHRVFLAEKWLVARLHYGHVDPREAGVGNIVNCGAAMYAAPIGIANAADPGAAYAEAIDVAGAHQSSYGREAAGVFAAAVAEAMRPGATITSVVDVALDVAHDGTRVAIEAVADAASRVTEWRSSLAALRAAVEPFDTVGPQYRSPAADARRPSRTKAIEELPIALGMAIAAGGDYAQSVLGGVNYGRDSDSIATMAGAVCGALGGLDAVPADWVHEVSRASRIDIVAPGHTMAHVAEAIWSRDADGKTAGTTADRRCDDRTTPTDGTRRDGSVMSGPIGRGSSPTMIRLSWAQPEDLLPHALVAAALDGCDVTAVERRWVSAGGDPEPPVMGASAEPAAPELRALARELLVEIDGLDEPAGLRAREPDDLAAIETLCQFPRAMGGEATRDRLLGAWLGRAVGCLLGKPVEKIPRAGIRAIAESTGNWPIRGYFSARGLDPTVAAAYSWNRRSAPNSLAENIDGMPEDDDLNYALIVLRLVEEHGRAVTTDDVATMWLDELPAGRVFTAERVTYRNLVDGEEPDVAARRGNPFQDWIGAEIRTDVYGWVSPGEPARAARLAWQDGRLTHRRNGLYGAMFVAAASSLAITGAPIDECVQAGLAVVPHASRYAAAVRRGIGLARSDLADDAAIDAIEHHYGHLHWVHVLNNASLLAFALTRSRGDFAAAVTTVVGGGWDTDSNGATAGAICGAICGAGELPSTWVAPLNNRLASSVRGFDRVSFDELADRTAAARSRLDD